MTAASIVPARLACQISIAAVEETAIFGCSVPIVKKIYRKKACSSIAVDRNNRLRERSTIDTPASNRIRPKLNNVFFCQLSRLGLGFLLVFAYRFSTSNPPSHSSTVKVPVDSTLNWLQRNKKYLLTKVTSKKSLPVPIAAQKQPPKTIEI